MVVCLTPNIICYKSHFIHDYKHNHDSKIIIMMNKQNSTEKLCRCNIDIIHIDNDNTEKKT